MKSLTIFIDGRQYASAKELHLALKMLLSLPEHYGCNADALYDCLSEMREKPRFRVMNPGSGEAADALRLCLRVAEDAGCEIVHC